MKGVKSITFQHEYSDANYPEMSKSFLENEFYPNVGDIIVDSNQTNFKVLERSVFFDEGYIDLLYMINDEYEKKV